MIHQLAIVDWMHAQMQRLDAALSLTRRRQKLGGLALALGLTLKSGRTSAGVWVHQHLATIESWLQLGMGGVLATFPWLHALGQLQTIWPMWLVALGLHALWLELRPNRDRLIPLASFALVAGLCAIQILVIYIYVVAGSPSVDYLMLASWISASTRDLSAAPANMWFYDPPPSYLATYFDPLVPLLNRVFDLTYSPFRLLGFQAAAILSAALATWWFTIRTDSLWPFQALLPTALLLHPSISTTLQADYHTSGIGLGLLLVGSVLFFRRQTRAAFAFLLLGTLTKISYWPSWLMFGVLHAFRREWRWAAGYATIFVVALALHQAVEVGHSDIGINLFFSNLGSTPLEVVHTLVFSPDRWLGRVVEPANWLFFIDLFLPIGFAGLAYPPVLTVLLPLIVFSLLDLSGYRRMVLNVYATEYLGFFVAAALVGLARVGPQARLVAVAAIALGMTATFANPARWPQWGGTLETAMARSPHYDSLVAFANCTIGDAPALTTSISWSGYVRGHIEGLWLDSGNMTIPDSRWQQFETLVYHANPAVAGSLTNFPNIRPPYNVMQYGLLLRRLPVAVRFDESWQFHGVQRLADCAAQFGVPSSPTLSDYPLTA
jgi:hypothetical protein